MPRPALYRAIMVAAMIVGCKEFPVSPPRPLKFDVQNPFPDTLTVTDTAFVDVSVKDDDGHIVTHAEVVAESSDPSILSVAPTHFNIDDATRVVLTALKPGVAEVSFTVEGGTGSVDVNGYRDTIVVNEHWIGVSVAPGRACGVTVNARAYCWGDGRNGLGDGSLNSSSRPIPVFVNAELKAVSTAQSQTCVTDVHGLAYCWGLNRLGEVGDGTQLQRLVPVAIAVGTTFTALSTGNFFTCGVTVPGKTFCWGESSIGALGNGSLLGNGTCFFDQDHTVACVPAPTLPVQTGYVSDPPRWEYCTPDSFIDTGCMLSLTTISAGSSFACGLTNIGAAFCWGFAKSLGGPIVGTSCSTRCSTFATLAGGGTDWSHDPSYTGPIFVALSAGGQACALEQGGRPYCWGAENFAPTPLPTSLRFTSISVGASHVCALTADGTAYCWGANESGQLGMGSTGPSLTTPTRVAGERAYSFISAGQQSTCAVSVAGRLYCWGNNDVGQLGTGDTNNLSTPTRVKEPEH